MEARKLVGWNIRRLRVNRGLTIEGLADAADVSPAYLGQLERGQVNVGLVLLDRLRRALGAELSDLVLEPKRGEKPPQPLSAGRRSLKEPAKQRGISAGHRLPAGAAMAPEELTTSRRARLEQAVRRLAIRDLNRHGLNLHTAIVAEQKEIEKRLETLFGRYGSDSELAEEPEIDRETLLRVRDLPWIGMLTFRVIGQLLMDPELATVLETGKRPAAKRSRIEKVQ